mgnify:FL=1
MTMKTLSSQHKVLEKLCSEITASDGLGFITQRLKKIFPEYDFKYVLTRGNWHRLGGVVDGQYQRVSDNIADWVNEQSTGDIEDFMLRFVDEGYFATVLAGKTHYFTASCGKSAEDFIQLEIEELQEVLDRPLIDPDWIPDNIEDFLDPLDYPRLEPESIAEASYCFRRITHVSELIQDLTNENRSSEHVRQFIRDWKDSSAGDSSSFCKHWVLALREYRGTDGEKHVTARPIPTHREASLKLPSGENYSGTELAHAVHSYDRIMGYPFSWYFMMISRKSENIKLVDAVLNDLMGAYDYLPAKDLKILREWVVAPYSV